MIDLKSLTIKKVHDHLINGDFSAKELVTEYLKVIKERDSDIHAYLEVFDDVLKQAEKADEIIKSGKSDILTGIPFAIKDNILIKDKKATSASKILENYIAPYDATVIKKLKDKGAIFLGRVNMDEFAMGVSTENSAFGPTKNPYDTSRVPGGSSGGSAAAVAMDGALVALGSDTGGSIRQPASFCGLVGLKPTYGSVSRYGLMAMASSFDQIGPITKNVSDAEIIFNAISGKDINDGTSFEKKDIDFKKEKKILSLGVPYEFFNIGGIDEVVLKNLKESIEKFKKLGYEIKEIKLPRLKYALAVYYILVPAEVSSNMARYDGMKYGKNVSGENLLEDYFLTRGELLGKEVRRRIIIGTYVLSSGYYDAYYNKAIEARRLISSDFDNAFKNVDLIITPPVPTLAWKIGEKTNNPLQEYIADIFTVPANIAGIPAMSIPSGLKEIDGKKIPMGIQLIAPKGEEGLLFRAGKDFLAEDK